MKIAIIGAGLAGLSCAHELQRLGHSPDVYEQKDRVGYSFPEMCILMQLFYRPIPDILKHFRDNFDLDLKPLNSIKELYICGTAKTAHITGNLGYFMDMTNNQKSIHSQILKQLRCPVFFEVKADYKQLMKEYDRVVVATGIIHGNVAETLGIWEEEYVNLARVGVLTGNFEPHTFFVWRKTDYTMTGYSYLSPFSEKRAKLMMILPVEVPKYDIDIYWNRLLSGEKISNKPIEFTDIRVPTGRLSSNVVDNLIFIGDAGGLLEPFLGLGVVAAIESGVKAARCIVYGLDFNQEIRTLKIKRGRLSAIRRISDKIGDDKFNLIVQAENTPVISQLIYRSNIDWLEFLGSSMQTIERLPFGRNRN